MCTNNTLSATGCNILYIVYEYKICLFDIMYENNVCASMNKSNRTSNNIGNEKWKYNFILEMLDCLYGLNDCEKWKCNIILEMLDCLYVLSDCGFSIDARQCLAYAATIWIFV